MSQFSPFLTGLLLAVLLGQLATLRPTVSVSAISYGTVREHSLALPAERKLYRQPARLTRVASPRDSILFVGDVLLARNVEYLMDQHGSGYPYAGLPFNDLTLNPYVVGNFEATVPELHKPTEPLQLDFSVAGAHLSAARAAGFTHFSLANNHSFDFGQSDFEHTKARLQALDLTAFGHPKQLDQGTVELLAVGEQVVALIGINNLETNVSKAEYRALFEYASRKSDFQVAFVHWGIEYETESSHSQKELAAQFVSYGADLIVGHHPHVVQEVDFINDVPVFYSLGNYIFDQYFAKEVEEGLLLQLVLDPNPTVYLFPVENKQLSQPSVMPPQKHQAFLAELASRSHPAVAEYVQSGKIPLLQTQVATSPKMAMMNK